MPEIYSYRILFVFLLVAFSGLSQERDMKKEQFIENELKTIAPGLVDEFTAGTHAMDSNNYQKADSLYTLVYAKAPDFDPVIRRLGTIKVALGKPTEGIALCEKALELNRSSANIVMLVSCLITYNDSITSAENQANLRRALDLLNEGKLLLDSDELEYLTLIAQVSLQLNEVATFRETTNTLISKHSDQMVSHYFAAILAATDSDWKTAEREIRIANKMGLSDQEMNDFLDSGVKDELADIKTNEDVWATVKLLLWIIAAWLCGFLLLYLIGFFLSFYTLRTIESQIASDKLQSGNALRSVYKILINSAGFYYYISLPIIFVLVLVLTGAIVWTFLFIGQIPIQLIIVLVIGAGATILGMVRSLFIKSNLEEPGRKLEEEEAPGLFALTKEVAGAMGTRPIDEIRITPDTDLAVYETGSWRAKLKDNGKRILIVGTGILKDFEKKDFRTILAHEYGHFAHRDTAGGGVALRVMRDMTNYYISLYNAGQATWWNLAFLFLRFYHFIFRRISAGATRLQEVLADRVAAQAYGAVSFQNGLTFVVKQNIEFITLANAEIEEAENSKRPYNNLYELTQPGSTETAIELEKALNRKTSEADTHPSPVDRFRYINGIVERLPVNDPGVVSDFFTDWKALTEEMTDRVRRVVAMNKQFIRQ